MPIEFYANNFATAINQGGGIDNVTDPVTFTVSSTTGAPAVPFRIIDDSEIMLVTAKTASTFTATRAQDSTTIAAHANASSVVHVLTRDGLIQQFGGLFSANTWSLGQTINSTLAVSGNVTFTGGQLDFRAYSGQADIVGGTTGFAINNNANNANNLSTNDAGDWTARLSMTAPYLKATGAPSLGSALSGRYIGNWSTTGTPTGLTGIIGDHGFDGNFNEWVCTVAGTPGTWQAMGMHRLGQITTAASQTTVDFTSIPAGYTQLRVEYAVRDTNAGATWGFLQLRFNNDSTSGNYQVEISTQVGGVAPTATEHLGDASGVCGLMVLNGAAANRIAKGWITIPGYTDGFHKQWNYSASAFLTNTTTNLRNDSGGGSWVSTAAITRITFLSNTAYLNGSVMTLYGLA